MNTTIDNITLNVTLDISNENITNLNIIGADPLIAKINKDLNIFYTMKDQFISNISDDNLISDKLKKVLQNIDHESKLINMKIKYESDIALLQKELEHCKNIHTTELENIKTDIAQKIEAANQINHSKYITEIEVLKATHEQQIQAFTNYDKLHSIVSDKYNSTVHKGDKGENEIKHYLNEFAKFNNDIIISDTSGMKGHGDLAVKYKEINISVEVKNYTNKITSKEIIKFYNSMDKSEYDFGIFVSMKTAFAPGMNIKPIDIVDRNGKLIIFLSNVNESNKNSLIFAIELFYQFYTLKKNNNITDATKYINAIKDEIKDLDDLIKDLDKFKDMIAKLEGKISKMRSNMFNITA